MIRWQRIRQNERAGRYKQTDFDKFTYRQWLKNNTKPVKNVAPSVKGNPMRIGGV